jgi:succinate dehydrogenase / fumarate reductase, membrane anchor subunit
MVTPITNLGRSGLYDWMIQRVSAIILILYILFLLGVVTLHPDMGYEDWQNLFALNSVRVPSLISIIAMCAHAWIGLWTISTDYFTEALLGSSAMLIRFVFQLSCLLVLFIYLVWCVQILWGL